MEFAKQYDLTVEEYLQQLIEHDLTASVLLSHETGNSSFHDIRDAITAMYLLDEYFRLDPPDDTYETFFLHTPGEHSRIWETVAGGGYYSNGNFGLCDDSARGQAQS